MSDAELIARLRDWEEYDEGKNNDAREAAADRIEALTEQLAAAQRDAKEAEAYAEELEKERDDYALKLMQAYNTYTEMHLDIERLSDKLATCEKYRDAYAGCDRIGTQAVRDLEAKLAKTVELLEEIEVRLKPISGFFFDTFPRREIKATLAEIKGENRIIRGLKEAIEHAKGESHD